MIRAYRVWGSGLTVFNLGFGAINLWVRVEGSELRVWNLQLAAWSLGPLVLNSQFGVLRFWMFNSGLRCGVRGPGIRTWRGDGAFRGSTWTDINWPQHNGSGRKKPPL